MFRLARAIAWARAAPGGRSHEGMSGRVGPALESSSCRLRPGGIPADNPRSSDGELTPKDEGRAS